MLERMLALVREIEAGLPDGVDSSVCQASEDRPLRSVYWTLTSGDRTGELGVWEDGNAELGLVDMANLTDRSEHRDLVREQDLADALGAVRDWAVLGLVR